MLGTVVASENISIEEKFLKGVDENEKNCN